MLPSSLRTLACVSVALLLAAACTSCSAFYDPDKLDKRGADDEGEDDDAPALDAGDDDGGDDDGGDDDGGESTLDAGEADAAPACGPEGQSCSEESPFFECNADGECAECGRVRDQPCCLTAPRCDEGLLVGVLCVNNLCI
jgi:hypothetical protein